MLWFATERLWKPWAWRTQWMMGAIVGFGAGGTFVQGWRCACRISVVLSLSR